MRRAPRLALITLLLAGVLLIATAAPVPHATAATTRADNNAAQPLPPTGSVEPPVTVSGVTGALTKVVVSLHITHESAQDLRIDLIAPDGTSVSLAAVSGGAGDDFGTSCSPDTSRTTFDDAAATAINDGAAPFAGAFRPRGSLAEFTGKSGPAVNGVWRLSVQDLGVAANGTFQCWSLILTTEPPAITSITPNYGPAGGGTPVTIQGSGFSTTPGQTRFVLPNQTDAFVNVQCTTDTCTATSVLEPVPSGGVFGLLIFAVVAGQESPIGPRFFWYDVPLLDSVTPATGPPAGGTPVTLMGNTFPNGGSVPGPVTIRFGTALATAVTCVTGILSEPSTCTATAPAGMGTVDVTIETPGGISLPQPFTYAPPPTVAVTLPAPDGANGWYRTSPITATVTATTTPPGTIAALSCSQGSLSHHDALLASVTARLSLSTEGTTSVICTATGADGQSGAAPPFTVMLDSVAPSYTVDLLTTADGQPYTPGTPATQPVTVTFTCTDATSGVAGWVALVTFGRAGLDQTATGTCTDVAGNRTTLTVDNIDIPKLAGGPAPTPTPAPTPGPSPTPKPGQPTPGPTATPAPTPAGSPKPGPATPTPTPAATPAPTPPPKPGQPTPTPTPATCPGGQTCGAPLSR